MPGTRASSSSTGWRRSAALRASARSKGTGRPGSAGGSRATPSPPGPPLPKRAAEPFRSDGDPNHQRYTFAAGGAAPTLHPADPHGSQRRGPAIGGQREATSITSAAVTTARGISQESHSPSPTPETGGVMPCASSRPIHGAASTQTAPSDHATTGA